MTETKQIKYREGYKYQLAEDYEVLTDVIADDEIAATIITEFIELEGLGFLTIYKGYAWDGATDPGVDTKNIMRGSLVHDALYQLIRQGKLDIKWREQADKELKRIFLEDSWEINKKKKFSRIRQRCSIIRVWWIYKGVRRFARFAALPENKKEVLTAP